ncbi:MAG: helix-turn-helix domain-containing protein [Armatimonadota bacterium]
MANYETKLGEWFKQVEQRAQELRARKRGESTPPPTQETAATGQGTAAPAGTQTSSTPSVGEPTPISNATPTASDKVSAFGPGDQTARVDSSVLTAIDERKTAVAEPAGPAGPALFDDAEIPPVEDFISFLDRAEDRRPRPAQEPAPAFETPTDQGTLTLAEGTGTPRPITPKRPTAPEPAPAEPEKTPASAGPPPMTAEEPQQQPSEAEQKWARVPQHLRVLFDQEVEEVAQHSYKTFKESRASLIERLLDPVVTLEDAARILNVCPTTVRRYTNRGILKHYRTAGNQRRFRLSDVLAFLEKQMAGNKK